MSRPRYPSDERSRLAKAERRAKNGQEPRPSGKSKRQFPDYQVDPEDYSHPLSDVRSQP